MSTRIDEIIEKTIASRNNCQLTTGFNRVKTIDNCNTSSSNTRIDRILAETADLRAPEFKAWHAQQARRLGVDRYLGLAKDARRGKQPARYFSYLLRNAA